MNSKTIFILALLSFLPLTVQAQDHIWRRRFSGEVSGIGINPLNPSTIFTANANIQPPDSLFVSYDRGVNWNAVGVLAYLSHQLLIHPEDTLVIFDGFTELRRSSDYGLTWTTVLSPSSFIESIDIDPLVPDKIYTSVYDGNIYRSTDRGLNWELLSRVDSVLCDLVIRPDSTNILYAGTGRTPVGKIWKSTDGGLAWGVKAATTEDEVSHLAIDFFNPSVAYATAAGGPQQGVWKTTDWGEHWGPVLTGYHGWYADIDRGSPAIVYVDGADESYPIRSTNEGASWETLQLGLAKFIFGIGIKVHPLNADFVWYGDAQGASVGGGLYRWAPLVSTIQGMVLDDETGEPVMNGLAELVSTGERVALDTSGGTYAFHYYEDDPFLSSTIHVEALPYYLHDEPVDFTLDSTTTHDIRLTKLPLSSIAGTVEDSITHAPVVAEVTLSVSSSLGDTTRSLVTYPDGSFLLDSLYVTYPPIISYGDITVRPAFPYALLKVGPVVVDTAQYVLVAPVDTADVLLTSSELSGDYSAFFIEALDSLRRSYYYWDRTDQGIAPMSRAAEMRKRALIYFTGDDTTALSQSELDSLTESLTSGVGLFITGQNFVEENASSEFVSQLLGLGYGGTSSSVICGGIAGELFGDIPLIPTSGGTGANNQISRDILQVTGSSAIATIGYGSGGNKGTAGVRLDNTGNGAKVVLFGFGLEAVNNRVLRKSLMHTVLGYFDGSIVVGVQESSPLQPLTYRLEQNYPNPFNPQTDVRYEIADVGFVKLVVYDILGREVATLVNEKKSPGRYTVSWDASGQASGVYFYRLKAGNFTETKKLLLIR